MNSIEKTRELIGNLSDLSNSELKEAYPNIPVGLLRTGLGMAEGMLPKDPADLDAQIERAITFATALRSDPE